MKQLKRFRFILIVMAILVSGIPVRVMAQEITALVLGSEAMVYSAETPTAVKTAAQMAKVFLGGIIQIADGTDDQVEINAAFQAINSGTVQLSAGQFNTSGSIQMPSRITHWYIAGIKLRGQGRATVIKLQDNANADVIVMGDGVTYTEDMAVEDLTIDGNKANQVGVYHGIKISNHTVDVDIENVYSMFNTGSGFYGDKVRYFRLNNSFGLFNDRYGAEFLTGGFHYDINGGGYVGNMGGIYSSAVRGNILNVDVSSGRTNFGYGIHLYKARYTKLSDIRALDEEQNPSLKGLVLFEEAFQNSLANSTVFNVAEAGVQVLRSSHIGLVNLIINLVPTGILVTNNSHDVIITGATQIRNADIGVESRYGAYNVLIDGVIIADTTTPLSGTIVSGENFITSMSLATPLANNKGEIILGKNLITKGKKETLTPREFKRMKEEMRWRQQ